jgi:hypothetical protein
MFAPQISSKVRFITCFVLALTFSIICMSSSIAIPVPPAQSPPAQSPPAQSPPAQSPPAQPVYLQQFFNYLNTQKYTLSLGEDRGACDYSIDPTDVYEQNNNRFVTAKVSRGIGGTACRGVLAFNILHADCPAKKLYEFQRETEGDLRTRGWRHLELSLVKYSPPNLNNFTSVTTEALAAQVCALPVRSPLPRP